MAEIAQWNGHVFTVSPALIRSFTGLTIKGGSETKDKSKQKQKFVARKKGNPSEVSITAQLNAFTGCDVQAEALAFVDEARLGAKGYFYMAGKKLIPCQLLLTEASVKEVEIAPGGTWVSCKVDLKMKQASKYDAGSEGEEGGGGGGKKKKKKKKKRSVRTSPTKTQTGNRPPKRDEDRRRGTKDAADTVNNGRRTSSPVKKPGQQTKIRSDRPTRTTK